MHTTHPLTIESLIAIYSHIGFDCYLGYGCYGECLCQVLGANDDL